MIHTISNVEGYCLHFVFILYCLKFNNPYLIDYRQIALKALNERLSRTTDSSKINLVPKSFPKTKYTMPVMETRISVEGSGQTSSGSTNLKNNEGGASHDVSININNFDRNSLI